MTLPGTAPTPDRHRLAIVLIAKQLGCSPSDIPLSANLADLPNMDSLKLLTSMGILERHYSIELNTEELVGVCTVGDLCGRFDARLASLEPPQEAEQP